MSEFIGILGDRGSGKTNLLTYFLYQAHLKGMPIIANYHLEFPATYMTFEQLTSLNTEISDAIIGMDELGEGADSYDFFASSPRKITKLISQIRKRRCTVYYTVQRFNLIMKRLREQTNGFILCEDLDIPHTPLQCNGVFRLTFLDQYYRKTGSGFFDGKPVRQLYNTEEIITARY